MMRRDAPSRGGRPRRADGPCGREAQIIILDLARGRLGVDPAIDMVSRGDVRGGEHDATICGYGDDVGHLDDGIREPALSKRQRGSV